MRSAKNNGRNMIRNQHGFSLIELMVVVVIVAILAAIEYPLYQESVRKARRAEGRAALMEVMQQQERYYSQNGTYIVFSAATANGYKWYSSNSAAASSYEISATACNDESIQNCVLLTAKPGTQNVNANYKDDPCGNLTLASSGEKAAAGSAAGCWQ
jgi:type IV pilus assembly protein PilE